jgi:Helix-hairpin-helix motif
MAKGLYREFYLLPRGEQRALLLLSLLLILSLAFRLGVQFLPEREPEGRAEFEQEARTIMAALARADSLQSLKEDSIRRAVGRGLDYTVLPGYQRKYSRSAFPVDLNRSDSAGLLPLPGIGPVFAGRIIKYRNLLGGYVWVEQLLEVYGMTDQSLEMIKDKIEIDSSVVRRICLDSASFKELLRHPYLEYKDVKALADYRDFSGSIQSEKELVENYILTDSVLKKVLPYFSFH